MSQVQYICLPGLAADERLFSEQKRYFKEKLLVPDLPVPQHQESLSDYALRFGEGFHEEYGSYVLIGVSFGAQLSLEIAKHYPEHVRKVVVISSHLLPTEYTTTFLLQSKALTLLPDLIIRLFLRIGAPFFAYRESLPVSQRKTLIDMAESCDMNFFRWAVSACLKWNLKLADLSHIQDKIIRFHGRKDWIIPFPKIEDPTIVEFQDGKHLIVYSEADTMNELLEQID